MQRRATAPSRSVHIALLGVALAFLTWLCIVAVRPAAAEWLPPWLSGFGDDDRGRCRGHRCAVRVGLSFAQRAPEGQRSGGGRCRSGRDQRGAGLQLVLELPRRRASGLLPAAALDCLIGQGQRQRFLAWQARLPQPGPGCPVGCPADRARGDLHRSCGRRDRALPISGGPSAGQPRHLSYGRHRHRQRNPIHDQCDRNDVEPQEHTRRCHQWSG